MQAKILHATGAHLSHGTASVLNAWDTGIGQCFDRASIIVAAYRKNNIPARVVGRNDFFDGDGEHWWVEAFVNGTWKDFDSTYNMAFIDFVLKEASRLGISKKDFPRFLTEIFEAHIARGVAVSQISSSGYEQKVRSKIVAAETDVLDA